MSIQDFSKITPYLTNPLVLIGLVVFLTIGLYTTLVKSKILPPVSARASGKIIQRVMRYAFVIALLTILLGFGKAFLNKKSSHTQSGPAEASGDCSVANTGNGNTITTDCSEDTSPKKPTSK